jgi:hypothetical protein
MMQPTPDAFTALFLLPVFLIGSYAFEAKWLRWVAGRLGRGLGDNQIVGRATPPSDPAQGR